MKLLKKLLWLVATLSAFVGFSMTTASCNNPSTGNGASSEVGSDSNNEDSSIIDSSVSAPEDDNVAFVYRVRLQNETGFGFSGATVKLMDGETVVAEKKTNASGNANFLKADVATVGTYDVVVENIPNGYELINEDYKTVALVGTETIVTVKPTGILQGEAPAGTSYQLGSVVYDFSVTLSDNTTYTLSEV